jgi:Tfp pilus assembly protein PilN
MIQFNLLPDIKVQSIRTQKTKRTVIVIAVASVAFSVGLLVLVFSFTAVQKQHIGNLDEDISSLRSELEGVEDLTEILSVQNQLNTLPDLYNQRPAVDRLPVYIDQTTPTVVKLNNLLLDYSTSTMEISGTADTLEAVNNYADTLKYTTYKVEGETSDTLYAFKDVVLKEFGRDDVQASFTITLTFDPVIYDISKKVQLTVPNLVTTRAQVPSAELFNGATVEEEQ